VGTKSEASHAADNVTRKIKKHVFRKGVWRMCDHGPPGREGAPLMVSGAFAVALSWMYIRIRCPIIQVPLPESRVPLPESEVYKSALTYFGTTA